jgi:hypothetical protein
MAFGHEKDRERRRRRLWLGVLVAAVMAGVVRWRWQVRSAGRQDDHASSDMPQDGPGR